MPRRSIHNVFPKLMGQAASPEFVLPDLDLLSSARICCPRPSLHIVPVLDISSNSENIDPTLPFNSLHIILFFKDLQGSQSFSFVHDNLNIDWDQNTLSNLLESCLQNFLKCQSLVGRKLPSCEIYSVSREMFSTRGKKMNT